MSQPALVAPLLSKDYLSVLDLSRTELEHVIALAAAILVLKLRYR